MKKLSLLPLLALIIAVAASAFTSPKTTTNTNEAWFVYNVGDPTQQESYEYYAATDPGCELNSRLCAVKAEIDPSTIIDNDVTTSLPMESGSGLSLDDLSDESDEFSHPSTNVQFQE